jgi:hypothetical protein
MGFDPVPVQAARKVDVVKGVNVSTIVGYGMSGLMGIVGVLVLSGILMSEGMASQLRILFGGILILYSVYRFIMTRTRARQEEDLDE